MFKNYLATAWRQILKNRLFSVINIFGLAVGMMSCILILLYVKAEVSYDTWIPNNDRIVRQHTAVYFPGQTPHVTVRAAGRMMEAVKGFASAEVEAGVRLLQDTTTIIKDGAAFDEELIYADASFFDVFSLPFASGDAATSFARPLDTVISEDTAIKYFGHTDVVGETLVACCLQSENMNFKITGVIKNMPENSHMNIGMLVLMDPTMFDFMPNILNSWGSVNTYTYFKLREGVSAADLKARLWTWLDNESPYIEMIKARMGEGIQTTSMFKPNIMPIADIYLHAKPEAGNSGDMRPLGDITLVYTFVGVAALLLLIASINFMNLSTAQASGRSREVALRKVLGATRRQVAIQFLGEAMTIAGLGLFVALAGTELFLPVFNAAIGRTLELSLSSDLLALVGVLVVAVVVGLLSGLYPAAYLSRFLPARVLGANSSSDNAGGRSFRSGLVVFQFAISIGLAMSTAVIYGQTIYAKTMDVGFESESKLVLGRVGSMATAQAREALRLELRALPNVTHAVLSSDVPGLSNNNNTEFQLQVSGSAAAGDPVILNYYAMGYGFFDAYQAELIAGRAFDLNYGAEAIEAIPQGEERVGTASIVLNESAVRKLGFIKPADAIDQIVRADVRRTGLQDYKIIGVVSDIYFRSAKFGVRPGGFVLRPTWFNYATISFKTDDLAALVRDVERVWQKAMPLTPVSHEFLSDVVNAQYQAEQQQANLFAAFSALAIVVACLGLFGLAAFSADQRTKEIGVRKVLGARVKDIVQLLVWQFSRPVLVANIIAWPIGWYLMSGWLEGFQYRLGDGFLVAAALASGGGALLVAWLTVTSRALKVARTNPIKALRYE